MSRRDWLARYHGEAKAASFELDPGPFGWLVDLCADAGFVRREVGMDGLILLGLRWTDLHAWVQCTGQALNPTHLRVILMLSEAYAQTAMAARDFQCRAPYDPGKPGG